MKISGTIRMALLGAVVVAAGSFGGGGCTFDESITDIRCMEAGARRDNEVCRDGFWVPVGDGGFADTTDVRDVSECTDGERRESDEPCGADGRGVWRQVCENGRWTNTECVGGWYRTCDEHLEAHPDAESGIYQIDIDGRGGRDPEKAYCLMRDHGWTLVARDTFDENAQGWSARVRTSCGDWGTILGGYCRFGDGRVSREFRIPPVAHTHAMVKLHFIQIDSWDADRGDEARVLFAGEEVWSKAFSGMSGPEQCGRSGRYRNDGREEVSETVRTGGTQTYEVVAGASLDEFACNEAWGIDDVRIFVR